MKENISIEFPVLLSKMIFKSRPNRFILHCYSEETNSLEVVHLADPGRLKELLLEDTIVYVLPSANPNRKTKWTAMLVESCGVFVSVNTAYPNKLAEKMLKEEIIPELAEYKWVKSEYMLGNSRWDFLLEHKDGTSLLLEVKSVTLTEKGIGMFPDAVTKRGKKHVQEITEIHQRGQLKTAILFIAQREDIKLITSAPHIDAEFAEALVEAENAGVHLIGYNCILTKEKISWNQAVPVIAKKKL
ncbi:DNA/RNA nuclease SfsA [Niallia nealsonii]|uniref:Sugar fermentation stimulation protein homolog n=1 Tax=Niallia nealsonii TaxID=115979 RepID=A0A2N0Z2C9_9BACI|nr:DNA/RNA nuclease SfsA [Niallia nealsonii]PKG23666.1 DNA/RNA nuclease SfsA [Niallia nealsonii]